MKLKMALTLIASTLGLQNVDANVITYPAGEGVPTNNDFTVNVRQGEGAWLPVVSYPVKVDEVKGADHETSVASMAYFDFEGPVEVEVVSNRVPVASARI
ncbi:MAG: endo-polygalacturonase, partial [Muribaculaceae bacterium]|nr:endo-polygalacturonase [Muribaculaceae bacterium]